MVDVEILIPDPENARKHSNKNLAAIRGSIKKFGIVEPLIVRRQNNVVIGGNGRLQVLHEIGIKKVPVHYVDMDDLKAKALSLALNRTAELAEWEDLISSINKSKLSDPEKEFLKIAAYRHVVFSYEKIAEFYAHADKDTQCLMEDSALVIIDFDKAIEDGFVSLAESVAEEYKIDEDNNFDPTE